MELYAAFVEDADTQAGKIIDELEEEGIRDNTLIFYIWGDNGASAGGIDGTISELLGQNQIPNTVEEQIASPRNAIWHRRRSLGSVCFGNLKNGQYAQCRLGLGWQCTVPLY